MKNFAKTTPDKDAIIKSLLLKIVSKYLPYHEWEVIKRKNSFNTKCTKCYHILNWSNPKYRSGLNFIKICVKDLLLFKSGNYVYNSCEEVQMEEALE